MVSSIVEAKDLSSLTIEELSGSLKNYEALLYLSNDTEEEVALQATTIPIGGFNNQGGKARGHGPFRGCFRGRDRGRFRESSIQTNSYKQQPKQRVQCYVCKKYGHTKDHCWYNDEANIAEGTKDGEEGNEEGLVFMAIENSDVEDGATWIIESGCLNHMTSNKDLFQCCEDVTQQTVKLGNGKVLKVSGLGTVSLQSSTGKASKLSQVQYVPELTHNLLSVG